MLQLNQAVVRRRTVLGGAAMALGSVLGGCGFSVRKSSGPPEFSAAQLVDDAEFSTLDELGIARIKASGSLRVDFRRGFIPKFELGLLETDYGPDVVANEGEKFRLSIRGTNGTLEAQTDHVRFFTTGSIPNIETITYFLTSETLEDYVLLLREAVSKYGLDAESVEQWIEGASRHQEDDLGFVVGIGSALGFDVEYDLRYQASQQVQVIIVTVSRTR